MKIVKQIIPYILFGFLITSFGYAATILMPYQGGTGISSYGRGDILMATSTNELFRVATGTEDQVLTIVNGIPAWAVAGGGVSDFYSLNDISLTSTSTGDILYFNGTDWINLATGTVGQVLEVLASGLPGWATDDSGGGDATNWTISGTAMSATDTVDTISAGTSTTMYLDLLNNRFGIGTSTLSGLLTIGTTSDAILNITTEGYVGIGTTTATSLFTIGTTTDAMLSLTTEGNLVVLGSVAGSNISVASSSKWDMAEGIVTASSTDFQIAFNWVTASSAEWSAAIDTEADPVFVASSTDYVPWSSASTSLWDIAYGWGNHAAQGYLTGITGQYLSWLADVSTTTEPTEGQAIGWDSANSLWVATTVSAAETDPVFVASSSDYVQWSSASTSNWDIVAGNAANVTLASSSAWDIAEGIVTLKVSIASTSLWDVTYANTLNVTVASSSKWYIAEVWVTAFDQRWVLGSASMIYASSTYTTLGIATTSPNTAYNLAIGGTLYTESTSTMAGIIVDNGIYNETTTVTIGSSTAGCIKIANRGSDGFIYWVATTEGWATTTSNECEW